MREQIGIHDDFTNVYGLYLTDAGNAVSRNYAYYFVTTDQKVYKISFIFNTSEFSAYTQTSFESFLQSYEREEVASIILYPENVNNG